jgi:hypothetical protein
MNVTFACPKCDGASRSEVAAYQSELECPSCRQSIHIPQGAFDGERLEQCLVCPSLDLFVRKDFPQRLGAGLVALGIIGSSIAWAYAHLLLTFGILFATALVDVLLYLVVPNALMCYRCSAQYRGLTGLDNHAAFNLETHERYRQQAARLAGSRH